MLHPPRFVLMMLVLLLTVGLSAGRLDTVKTNSRLSMSRTGSSSENAPATLPRGADLVLLNGKIWTGEPTVPPGKKAPPARIAEAVAMVDGRFLAIGTDEQIRRYVGQNSQVLDLKGRLAGRGLSTTMRISWMGASSSSRLT